MSGCCGVDTSGGRAAGGSSIRRVTAQTVGAGTVDVLIASAPTIGIHDIRQLHSSSWYDDGATGANAIAFITGGFLVNDGVGTVTYVSGFSLTPSYGGGVAPTVPAFVVVGTDLFLRFTGIAGQTLRHEVIWERYTP